MGTLPTEMENMNQLCKLLCTHCLNSLMGFSFCMTICISLLWIYHLNMESVNWFISHCLQVLWLSHFKGYLDLSNNELTGTLPTEMGNMNQLSKLLCTHCLNHLMHFVFCMNCCIPFLCIYYFNMESVTWLISHCLQVFWLSHFKVYLYLYNNELMGTLPTEIGNMNQLCKLLCTYCLNSLMDFVFCMIICISLLWIYIWIWRVLTDQNFSPLASLVTFSFQSLAVSSKQRTDGYTSHWNGKHEQT